MKKIFSVSILFLLFFGTVLSTRVSAQALSNDDLKTMMAEDWVRGKAYTIEYLNTMPAGKYSFKAADSIRSFAMQMLHLAVANIFLMATATDQQPLPWVSFGLEKSMTAQSKARARSSREVPSGSFSALTSNSVWLSWFST